MICENSYSKKSIPKNSPLLFSNLPLSSKNNLIYRFQQLSKVKKRKTRKLLYEVYEVLRKCKIRNAKTSNAKNISLSTTYIL